MSDRRYPKLSIRGPVTLFVIVLILMVTLTVLWNVALVQDYQKLRDLAQAEPFHWTFIALGSLLFLTIIVLSSILSAQLIAQIRWSQRQSNFISSVSHELNSPLSSIKLLAQTLRKPELSTPDRLNFVGKILDDVERLHRLIANILRAAEMDYHGDELHVVPQQVELVAYLRDFVEAAGGVYRASGLRLALLVEGRTIPHRPAAAGPEGAGEPIDGVEPIWVRLDPLMFRQVLDNLVDNAVRYRGEGEPEVEIRVLCRGGHVELHVRDQGIGIPDEALPKLFDRFYRIEQTDAQRRRKGTGIGLYVVRSIVLAHGGKIEAWSDGPGKGSTLWIRLPLPGAEGQRAALRERWALVGETPKAPAAGAPASGDRAAGDPDPGIEPPETALRRTAP
ncbi:MAG: HAMP domain-containing histidine kinase [Holophagales bacterium]|nr:HAMP domain-containing histidine kinase [Holophagales bacterium]